jgi:hypothetical protein
MATIKIETTKAYAKELLKKLNEDKKIKTAYLSEPEVAYQQKLTSADWVRPGRPATEEEIDELIRQSEKGKGIPFEIAKERLLKPFKTAK